MWIYLAIETGIRDGDMMMMIKENEKEGENSCCINLKFQIHRKQSKILSMHNSITNS